MARQWAVGVTRHRKESLAKRELENQKFETYLPMCIADWAPIPKIKPFLIGYIFIGLDPNNERWRSIYSTFGMRSVLCCGEHPRRVSEDLINEIKEREGVDGWIHLPPRV